MKKQSPKAEKIYKVLNESKKGDVIIINFSSLDYTRKMVNNYNLENDRYFIASVRKGVLEIREF
jgi:hypothetical protein